MKYFLLALAGFCASCMYDATPPGAEELHDSGPIVVVDAMGLAPLRAVRVTFIDNLGTTVRSSARERTDADGRFFYPLSVARGTRNLTLAVTVDQDNDGVWGSAGDKSYGPQIIALTSDTQIYVLRLKADDFSP